ncbi:Spy/CpxP family protein refolding chaperone [Imbroritus primus]|uniref:Spy/CpxP family protein refolding chaperone n=1 Tax=Imbroritus primus TaxID=3058603 RepID=UPI003D1613CC
MITTKRYLTVLMTSAALLGAGAVSAQSAPPQGQPPAAGERAMHKHDGGERGKHHFGHRGHHRGDGMMMRGLNLSDAQKDQIFKIRHAQMPAVRDQMKIVRANRAELRKLSLATTFDAAKARQLAGAEAQARASLSVMRAETQQKIFALLTPEQRQQVLKRQQERAERGERGMRQPA